MSIAMLRRGAVVTLFTTALLLVTACRGPLEAEIAPMPGEHVVEGHVRPVGVAAEACPVCGLYERHRDRVVRLRRGPSLGAGFVVDARGLVLTNAHVVDGSGELLVESANGQLVPGRVVRSDATLDLALVVVPPRAPSWQALDWRDAGDDRVGSTIYVIGHPLGLGWTVTEGLLSGRRRPGEAGPTALLQTDAAISPGNSGGPMFDGDGRLLGVVSAKLVAPEVDNIAFAIPWDVTADFVDAGLRDLEAESAARAGG